VGNGGRCLGLTTLLPSRADLGASTSWPVYELLYLYDSDLQLSKYLLIGVEDILVDIAVFNFTKKIYIIQIHGCTT
jgi:hypothetical protein